jgi:hypothetical protein
MVFATSNCILPKVFRNGKRTFHIRYGKTVIPPDADKWRQCHRCGTIYARYEAKLEAE